MSEHYYGHARMFLQPTTHEHYHVVVEDGKVRDYFTTHNGQEVDGNDLASYSEMEPQISEMLANGSLRPYGTPLGPIPISAVFLAAKAGFAVGLTPEQVDALTDEMIRLEHEINSLSNHSQS